MNHSIHEVVKNKGACLESFLHGEPEEAVRAYLDKGRVFVLDDGGVKCVAVVLEWSAGECEVKNIITLPASRGKGYGRAMVRYLQNLFLAQHDSMYVSAELKAIRFYQKCGFRYSHNVPEFAREIQDNSADGEESRLYLLCSRTPLRERVKPAGKDGAAAGDGNGFVSEQMSFEYREVRKGVCYITVSGKIAASAAEKFEQLFMPLMTDERYEECILDCRGVEYISSLGLRIFMKAMQVRKAHGRAQLICRVAAHSMFYNSLIMVGLSKYLTIRT